MDESELVHTQEGTRPEDPVNVYNHEEKKYDYL